MLDPWPAVHLRPPSKPPSTSTLACASITKASAGDLDNTPLIDDILALRAEKAAMLGFANYGEVSMARKMATVDKANALLDDLRDKSYAAGVQDHEDVIAFAKAQGCDYELKHWDVNFW